SFSTKRRTWLRKSSWSSVKMSRRMACSPGSIACFLGDRQTPTSAQPGDRRLPERDGAQRARHGLHRLHPGPDCRHPGILVVRVVSGSEGTRDQAAEQPANGRELLQAERSVRGKPERRSDLPERLGVAAERVDEPARKRVLAGPDPPARDL